jgi:predicted DNA-binding protein
LFASTQLVAQTATTTQEVFFAFFSACATMRTMTLGASIGVRLDPALRKQLQEISDGTGISAGNIIRMALETYVNKVETDGAVTVQLRKSEPLRHAADASPEYGTRKKGAKP